MFHRSLFETFKKEREYWGKLAVKNWTKPSRVALLNRNSYCGIVLTTEKWEQCLVVAAASNRSPTSVHFALASQVEKSATRTSYSSYILAHAIGFTACWISWTSATASCSRIYKVKVFLYWQAFQFISHIPNTAPRIRTTIAIRMNVRVILILIFGFETRNDLFTC
jgi:hypothetical protein